MTDIIYFTQINYVTWKVVFVNESRGFMINCNGLCVYQENTIYVMNNLIEPKKKYALIHELTHAYEFQHGLQDRKSDDVHEDLAEFVGLYGEQIIEQAKTILSNVFGG